MAAKKVNYEAQKEFEFGGTTYKKGETFKIPPEWVVDEDYTKLRMMAQPNNNQTAFNYEIQIGLDEQFVGAEIVRKPIMEGKRVVLPVA